MAEIDLTQAEADALLAMEKRSEDSETKDFPTSGERIEVSLVSMDKRERFFLDISRSRIEISRGTYQNRGRQVIVLARLDFGGKPHRNPDDEELPTPHLHCIGKDMALNGRFQFRLRGFEIWAVYG